MVTVRIGSVERSLSEVTESWINEQVSRRRADGQAVCVQVLIRQGGLDLALATPACSRGGGGGRQPTQNERRIIELWDRLHLNREDFAGGNVVAFLKQLERQL